MASHSRDGVIELMPVADAFAVQLQVRQRPPRQHAHRPAHRDGVRRAGRRGHRQARAAERADADHRAAHRRDVGARGTRAGAPGQPHDGADRQRRAEPNSRRWPSITCSASTRSRLFDIDPAATAKLLRNLRHVPGLALKRVRQRGRAPRAAPTSSPPSRPTRRTRRSSRPTCWRRACTSTPSAATARARPSCTPACCRRARVVVEYEPQTRIEGDIQQMPADVSGHRAVAGAARPRAGPPTRRAVDGVRFGRLRAGGLLRAALAARQRARARPGGADRAGAHARRPEGFVRPDRAAHTRARR